MALGKAWRGELLGPEDLEAINALRAALSEPEQAEWDAIPDEFNAWWDGDLDDSKNPYREDSPIYWAWEGWKAAMKQRTEPEKHEDWCDSLTKVLTSLPPKPAPCNCKRTEPEQEPVAWRTFDGERGYEYRTYEDNENYRDEWDKRNPNHKGWVEPLYKNPTPCETCQALARTVMMDQTSHDIHPVDDTALLRQALEAFEWNMHTDLDNIPACEQWVKMLKTNITALRERLGEKT